MNAIEIKSDIFFNLDTLLDKYYKRPESGSVNCTCVFTIYNNKPGILALQYCTKSPVCTQNLKKGNMDDVKRKKKYARRFKKLVPMQKPGMKPINKHIELGTKWRDLLP